MDNSDSPSIVEQLSQGPSLSYNTFISDSFPSSLMYFMPFALFLASCSMGSPMSLILFLDLMFPSVIAVDLSSYCLLGFCSLPFYLGYSPIELWDNLSGYAHPGIACLAFQASDWPGAFWASLCGYSSRCDPCQTNYDWSLL